MPLVEGIVIRVTSEGIEVVRDKMSNLGNETKKTSNAVSFLKKTFATFGAALITRQIIGMADSFTLLQNRLAVYAESQTEVNFLTEELLRISNATRTSVATNAEVFQRFRISADQLGLSIKDVLQLTESITQATVISGATAQEATGALRQLSQAFSGNRLSGQELNSVLEQLPEVTRVIAKEMGIATNEVRKLANEGFITSKVMVDAFRNAREELEAKFAKTLPTVSQAMIVFGNNATIAFGELSKATGSSQTLAAAINLLGSSLTTLVPIILTTTTTIATFLVAKAVLGGVTAFTSFTTIVRGLTVAMATLNAVVAANPLVFLVTVAAAAASTLFFFGARTERAAKELDSFSEANKSAAEASKAAELSIAKQFDELQQGIEVTGLMADGLTVMAERQKILNKLTKTGIELTSAQTKELTKLVKESDALDAQAEAFDRIRGPAIEYGRAIQAVNALVERGSITSIEAANDIARLTKEYDEFNKASRVDPRTESFQSISAALNAEIELLKEGNGNQNVRNELIKLENSLRQEGITLTESEREFFRFGLEQVDTLQRRKDLLQEINGVQDNLNLKIETLNQLLADGDITQDQFNDKMLEFKIQSLEASTEMGDGFERAFLKAKKGSEDFASIAENVTTSAIDGMSDAMADFVTTGELNFSKLADSILQDLTRVITKMLIVKAIEATFGGGGNPIAAAAPTGRAIGGFASRGQPIMTGERGRELFVPNQGGTIINNTNTENMVQSSPQVNLNVVNVTDPNEVASALNTPGGEKAVMNVIRKNRRTLQGI